MFLSSIGPQLENTIDNKMLSKRFSVQLNVVTAKEFRTIFEPIDISHHINQHLNGLNSSNMITMQQLLEGEEYKFIIIRGVGCMGKTHLTEEISLRWANDSSYWNNLKFVFLLKCRELNNLNITSYKETLPLKYRRVFKYLTFDELTTYSSQLLIILDGLDEQLAGHSQLAKVFEPLDPANNGLPDMKVIVAGRPLSIFRFVTRFRKYNRKLVDILGFSEESVIAFIGYMVSNITTSKRVKQLVKDNKHFELMSRIRVYLKLICSLYSSYELIGPIVMATELYVWQLAQYIKEHVGKEMPSTLDEPHEIFELPWVQNILIEVAELSYEMFVQGLAIIEQESNVKWKMYDKLEVFGCGLKVTSSKFQFFHMTLQEFMVAIHLSLNENLFCEVGINENSEVLSLYAGLQGGLVVNSQSATIIKHFARVMNFTRNSNTCSRKVSHFKWTRLHHEYHNKQDNNAFFWNMSVCKSHRNDIYFHEKVFEDWEIHSTFEMRQGIVQKYIEESIDEYCLTDALMHIYVLTMTYYPCNNGYSLNVKFKPCIADKQMLIRKDIGNLVPRGVKCFTSDKLLSHKKINFNLIKHINYVVLDPASHILKRSVISVSDKQIYYVIGYMKSYNRFVEQMKIGIKERGEYFKPADFVSIIDYEIDVSRANIVHNTTVRISRRDRYSNHDAVNIFVIIFTLCCQNTSTSCRGLSTTSYRGWSTNLYKRFNRNTNACWEERREIVYF